jgi:hypothetical protein
VKYHVKIRRDGTLEWLGSPPPGFKMPAPERIRFSEILPVQPWLRRVFRALRFLFGENGHVAEWTRTWQCGWECIILRGPERGRCARQYGRIGREALVNWEHSIWLGTAPDGSTRELRRVS